MEGLGTLDTVVESLKRLTGRYLAQWSLLIMMISRVLNLDSTMKNQKLEHALL
jgi:hypothetical protein